MVTNYPQTIAAHRELSGTQGEGFVVRILDRVRQAICGMHGHDTLLQFEQERMYLQCVSCGHRTPGWDLNEAKPTVTLCGDARRHSIARPQLVSARKIA